MSNKLRELIKCSTDPLIIKHGEVFKKVPESELLEALRYELLHWNE